MDTGSKIDQILEKLVEIEVTTARLAERMGALKEAVDDGKAVAREHYASDESRFSDIEERLASYRGAIKVWAWIIAVIAALPTVLDHLFGK